MRPISKTGARRQHAPFRLALHGRSRRACCQTRHRPYRAPHARPIAGTAPEYFLRLRFRFHASLLASAQCPAGLFVVSSLTLQAAEPEMEKFSSNPASNREVRQPDFCDSRVNAARHCIRTRKHRSRLIRVLSAKELLHPGVKSTGAKLLRVDCAFARLPVLDDVAGASTDCGAPTFALNWRTGGL